MDDLWQKTLNHLSKGNFSALEQMLGGPGGFDRLISAWHKAGNFDAEPEMLAEALSCACMLGRTETARYLLDAGIDPYAGMKTWLAGPHYAVSGGHLETVKMLIEKRIPLEVKNLHGGTVLGQALWSAINENKPTHAAIVEALLEAGGVVESGTLEWWRAQKVPDKTTKERVENLLTRLDEFQRRVSEVETQVAEAESIGHKQQLADSLKALGNILRRPPFLRDAANEAYGRAAALYRELGMPLDEAWVKRHIGINHEYAGRLESAEKFYDEALELYREHSQIDDLNYANAVRYPAVIKGRLGKRMDSANLWNETIGRYEKLGIVEGIVEGSLHMAVFAFERGDLSAARHWVEKARSEGKRSDDQATHQFIADIAAMVESVP